MRASARAGVALLAVVLAGCGGGEQSQQATPAPATTRSTEPTPAGFPMFPMFPVIPAPGGATSTPSTLTQQQAAERYQELVAPANADISRLVRAVEAVDWEETRAAAQRMLSSHRAVSLAVQEEAWPPSVRPAVDGFVDALTADLPRLQAIADAETEQEVWDAVQTYAREEETPSSVDLLRTRLGLPSAPLAVEEAEAGASA